LWATKEENYDFGGLVITGWQEKGLCEDGFEMGSFGLVRLKNGFEWVYNGFDFCARTASLFLYFIDK
jgi:hypothetical protein